MTARLFGFDLPLTALFTAMDIGVRWLAPGNAQARPRAFTDRRLAYSNDRMLNDIGLRRDDFPSEVRERLQVQVMRFHI